MKEANLILLLTVTLMLLYGIAGAYQPSVQASIPALTSQDNFMAANSIINTVSSFASLIGPVLGGIFASFISRAKAKITNAVKKSSITIIFLLFTRSATMPPMGDSKMAGIKAHAVTVPERWILSQNALMFLHIIWNGNEKREVKA